jgi:hypothetical protein
MQLYDDGYKSNYVSILDLNTDEREDGRRSFCSSGNYVHSGERMYTFSVDILLRETLLKIAPRVPCFMMSMNRRRNNKIMRDGMERILWYRIRD